MLRRNSWNITHPVDFLSLTGQAISKLSAPNEFRTPWAADVTGNCGLLWKRGIRSKIRTIELVLSYWKYLCRNSMQCSGIRAQNNGWSLGTNFYDTYMIIYNWYNCWIFRTWKDNNVICKKYTAMYFYLDKFWTMAYTFMYIKPSVWFQWWMALRKRIYEVIIPLLEFPNYIIGTSVIMKSRLFLSWNPMCTKLW